MKGLLEAAMRAREQDLLESRGRDLPTDACYAGGLMRRKFSQAQIPNPLRERSKPVQLPLFDFLGTCRHERSATAGA